MAQGRQLSLFRRPKAPRAPRGEEPSQAPPRLSFGEPESLAYKRSLEEEASRRQREQAEKERREHWGETLKRRREEYPPEEAVLAALRREVEASDAGMPPKRERLEARVRESLLAHYPAVPLEHVHHVFNHALESGLLRHGRLRWEWVLPAVRPGVRRIEEADVVIASLVSKAAVVMGLPARAGEPARASGAATLVTVEETPCLLTAFSVWQSLEGQGTFELGLGPGCIADVDVPLAESFVRSGLHGPWGPDLCLIVLPSMLRDYLAHAGKVPYRFDVEEPPVLAEAPVFVLTGHPGSPPAHGGVLRRRTCESYEGVAHDYLDIAFPGRGHPHMTGGGLWRVPVDAAGLWDGSARLDGVCFWDLPDPAGWGVRCHGRQSIEGCLRQAAGILAPRR